MPKAMQTSEIDEDTNRVTDAFSPEEAGTDVTEFASFDDAIASFGSQLIVSAGAELVRDKGELEGTPFLITRWDHRTDNTTGQMYVSVQCITPENRKLVFNDGSTGVYAQLSNLEKQIGKRGGVMCRNGLRSSTFTVDKDGRPTKDPAQVSGKATTFYLA